MRVYPAGAGYDDDPRRRLGTAAGETSLSGLSSYSGFSATRLGFAPKARWLYTRASEVESGESIRCGATIAPARRLANWPNILPRSAQLTSEAAETLRSASGGVPAASGEAAATEGPEGPRRQAVRSRGGRGAVLDSRRVSPRRVAARVRFARVRHSRGRTARLRLRRWWR